MIVVVAIVALLFFAIALAGVISLGVLAVVWGPAAFASFACFVTLHQAGADGWSLLGATLLTFVVVRVVTGLLVRMLLHIMGGFAPAYERL